MGSLDTKLRTLGALSCVLFALACGDDAPPADAGLDGMIDGRVGTGTSESPLACDKGELGCSCGKGNRCNAGEDNRRLSCVSGICQADCTPGDTGCVCKLGTQCSDKSANCKDHVCLKRDCDPGSEGCSCFGGACDPGLFCKDGDACVNSKGYEGGACLDNGSCKPGTRCDVLQNVCVYCEAGSEGCYCKSASACNGGLACLADLCVSASSLPPKDPKCYTPCLTNLVGSDKSRACDADGLIEGCVGGKECKAGSCVNPGDDPPKCDNEMQCPFFQTCLEDHCYSNCQVNADCPPGTGCFRKVCRVACNAEVGGSACPPGSSCVANDGSNGFCSPSGDPAKPVDRDVIPTGGLTLSEERLEFTNLAPERSVRVTGGAVAGQVQVHKLWHVLHSADGKTERVDAKRDPASGEFQDCDAAKGQCPLAWLELAQDDKAGQKTQKLTVDVPAACSGDACPRLRVLGAGGSPGVRWEGELLLQSSTGSARISLAYTQTPEGRWAGSMYYLNNFGDQGLAGWVQSSNKGQASDVKNGLIQVWSAFRRGALDNWREMLGVLTSTRTESWKFDRVQQMCSELTKNSSTALCYPHDNPTGVRVFVQNKDEFPVPSGVTELPIAFHLKRDGDDKTRLKGVIDSATAMQYPARPAVTFDFASDPGEQDGGCDSAITSDCAVFLDDFSADVVVGGRYHAADNKCDSNFELRDEPWLLPDFIGDTRLDTTTNTRRRTECRDKRLPYMSGEPGVTASNIDLAGANPAPDGLARLRRIRLLDGALINQTELLILFEESFPSFLPNNGTAGTVKAYGFMLLNRDARELADSDYAAVAPPSQLPAQMAPSTVSCSSELRKRAGVSDTAPLADVASTLADTLMKGRGGSVDYVAIPAPAMNPPPGTTFAHYLCEETGVFDGGPQANGATSALACPPGSAVTYFLNTVQSLNDQTCQAEVQCDVSLDPVMGGNSAGNIIDNSIDGNGLSVKCSKPGSCKSTLNQWIASKPAGFESNPLWQCSGANAAYCNGDRFDLRTGKTFYRFVGAGNAPPPIAPIQTTIDDAFRYKTRFVSSSGTNVGFAPQICQQHSDQIPYCYDPSLIEDLRSRSDCLLNLYTTQQNALGAPQRTAVEAFLRGSFAQFEAGRDGYERLYAELLVMLGDDSVASSYASRFDLAASNGSSFFGSQLEIGGVDLSGVPGYEMTQLYQGVQYYQLALDRMYLLGPNFAAALSRGSTNSTTNFISPATVTLYLERLAGASSKKARAWGEVAKRYLALNRPDLARTVVRREYVRTYLEGVLLSKLMIQISELSSSVNKDQLRGSLEFAQRSYRMALVDMVEVYRSIDDDTTVFGFPPDYIPFPALDSGNIGDTNAYEVLANLAMRKIDVAAAREEAALTSARTGRTDSASFQAELVRIRNTYEDQLSEICGTFTADDGRVLPATDKYAALNQATRLMGDPCGRVGNGQIRDSVVNIQDAAQNVSGALSRAENIVKEVQIERERVSRQCKLSGAVADYEYQTGKTKLQISKEIAKLQLGMGVAQRTVDTVVQAASTMANCDGPIGCASAGISAGVIAVALSAGNIAATVLEDQVNEKQQNVQSLELENAHWVAQTQCDAALIDSDARTKTLALGIAQVDVELLRANLQTALAASALERLQNQAKRLRGQQREAEQMLLNVEAARNDPNVRIYRNDAIINADVTFEDALRAAYRATRVFEYYTSQSYAQREQLYLIRMISAGQYNLQNYLTELQNAFFDFEERFGVPDTRVQVLSLRDDILKIPLLDPNGAPYTRDQRVAQMQQRLRDPALLDSRGYLNLSFAIDLSALSPLTRNHKVRYVEADIVGSDVGDTLGRVYLRQAGTGTLRGLGDRTDYYAFPERTTVLNTFFNGSRVYGPEVYRSSKLRDRPIANSLWELVINQRDEQVNADINLKSLTDVRLLIYYDDFTQF
jgi:hypothetical protein